MLLIDVNALIADIERTIEESGCVNHEGEIMDCIRYASEVDAVPVVRGEWEYEHGAWCCSKCGENNPYGVDYETNRFAAYCPNCGADMRGSEGKE